MVRKKTTQECIREFEDALGVGRWDYSEVEYVNSATKVTIVCPTHQERFQQFPQNHRRGQVGCSQCFSKATPVSEFVRRAKEVHGDKYDYSSVQYVNSITPVEIICRTHGSFTQAPSNHLAGREGCKSCLGRLIDTESFLRKAAEVWNGREEKWDYSEAVYVNQGVKVKIICPMHGPFYQNPRSHIKGMVGCSGCHGMNISTPEFVERAVQVFPDSRWNYSEVEYLNMKDKVQFICPKHGPFHQSPEKHLLGKVGCFSCQSTGSSIVEGMFTEFISSLGVEFLPRKRELFANPRMEVDIWIPSKKVAIEFNGLYWHSSKFKSSKYHANKYKAAKEAGIRLVQVWEDDWMLRPDIVKEHIRQVLGMSSLPKVSARSTEVVQISVGVAREFFDRYHIQGFRGGSVYLGLKHGDAVCAGAIFKRRSNSTYELVRYASNANVRGGHSKLVSYFEKNYSYDLLITFADLTFSDGGLYRSTGWVEDGTIPPDYSYLVRGRREHKFNYRIKRFKEDPNLLYVDGATESQLAELNNLARVYDAGKIRFHKPRS